VPVANSYYVGNQVICQAVFTLVSTGALVDPTDVYFQVKVPEPPGTITTYHYGVDPEVARLSVGTYTSTINITDDGIWYQRWYSTGTGMAAAESRIDAKPSEFD